MFGLDGEQQDAIKWAIHELKKELHYAKGLREGYRQKEKKDLELRVDAKIAKIEGRIKALETLLYQGEEAPE